MKKINRGLLFLCLILIGAGLYLHQVSVAQAATVADISKVIREYIVEANRLNKSKQSEAEITRKNSPDGEKNAATATGTATNPGDIAQTRQKLLKHFPYYLSSSEVALAEEADNMNAFYRKLAQQKEPLPEMKFVKAAIEKIDEKVGNYQVAIIVDTGTRQWEVSTVWHKHDNKWRLIFTNFWPMAEENLLEAKEGK